MLVVPGGTFVVRGKYAKLFICYLLFHVNFYINAIFDNFENKFLRECNARIDSN